MVSEATPDGVVRGLPATRVARVADLPPGEGRAFAVAGEQVAVFRLRTGALHAVSAVCPHRGGPIADGQTDARVVMCPLHGNTFELATGACLTGQRPLSVFPVAEEDGWVVVGG
ncbi:nitrite reductase (NADH) small subunit [Cellulomonas marina]|uniref:Nitrite reductase (NADH) small subunit n=1 Tax=Cellulomonas marina TaxID=988821 RepID=A0A1I1AUK9_9CELL|nr:nitrite reductase (NADH) small subunit [Cellulomonas marina]